MDTTIKKLFDKYQYQRIELENESKKQLSIMKDRMAASGSKIAIPEIYLNDEEYEDALKYKRYCDSKLEILNEIAIDLYNIIHHKSF